MHHISDTFTRKHMKDREIL